MKRVRAMVGGLAMSFLKDPLDEAWPSGVTVSRRIYLPVDRITPLEQQLGFYPWWEHITSENFPQDPTRPSAVYLAEAWFNTSFSGAIEIKSAIDSLKSEGVQRSADPYEFAALLRYREGEALEYPTAAVDQMSKNLIRGKSAVPCTGSATGGVREIVDASPDYIWKAYWRYLVVCDPE